MCYSFNIKIHRRCTALGAKFCSVGTCRWQSRPSVEITILIPQQFISAVLNFVTIRSDSVFIEFSDSLLIFKASHPENWTRVRKIIPAATVLYCYIFQVTMILSFGLNRGRKHEFENCYKRLRVAAVVNCGAGCGSGDEKHFCCNVLIEVRGKSRSRQRSRAFITFHCR